MVLLSSNKKCNYHLLSYLERAIYNQNRFCLSEECSPMNPQADTKIIVRPQQGFVPTHESIASPVGMKPLITERFNSCSLSLLAHGNSSLTHMVEFV